MPSKPRCGSDNGGRWANERCVLPVGHPGPHRHDAPAVEQFRLGPWCIEPDDRSADGYIVKHIDEDGAIGFSRQATPFEIVLSEYASKATVAIDAMTTAAECLAQLALADSQAERTKLAGRATDVIGEARHILKPETEDTNA